MANIKIAQLTNQTAISDSDLVIIETATSTNKMTVANLKEQLGINSKVTKNPVRTPISLTLASGVTGFAKYHKDDMGVVTIAAEVQMTNTGLNNDVVLGLPSNILPNTSYLPIPTFNASAGTTGIGLYLLKAGTIKVSGSPHFAAGHLVSFEITYIAE